MGSSSEGYILMFMLFYICQSGKWVEKEYYGDQGELMIHRYQIFPDISEPTQSPTSNPSVSPANKPTTYPTLIPTKYPTLIPSLPPTHLPTEQWDSSPLKSKTKSKFSKTKKHQQSANSDLDDERLLNELDSKSATANTNRFTTIYLYGMELQQREYLSDLELYVLKGKKLTSNDLLLVRTKPNHATSAKIQHYHFSTDLAFDHFVTFFKGLNASDKESFNAQNLENFVMHSLWYLSQINPVIWQKISGALSQVHYNISAQHRTLFHAMRYGHELCTRLNQKVLDSKAKSKLPFSLTVTPGTLPMVLDFLSFAIQLLVNEKMLHCMLILNTTEYGHNHKTPTSKISEFVEYLKLNHKIQQCVSQLSVMFLKLFLGKNISAEVETLRIFVAGLLDNFPINADNFQIVYLVYNWVNKHMKDNNGDVYILLPYIRTNEALVHLLNGIGFKGSNVERIEVSRNVISYTPSTRKKNKMAKTKSFIKFTENIVQTNYSEIN